MDIDDISPVKIIIPVILFICFLAIIIDIFAYKTYITKTQDKMSFVEYLLLQDKIRIIKQEIK